MIMTIREECGEYKSNPCSQDCPERTATCHATCPRYAEFYAYNRKRNEASLRRRIARDVQCETSIRIANNMRRTKGALKITGRR